MCYLPHARPRVLAGDDDFVERSLRCLSFGNIEMQRAGKCEHGCEGVPHAQCWRGGLENSSGLASNSSAMDKEKIIPRILKVSSPTVAYK